MNPLYGGNELPLVQKHFPSDLADIATWFYRLDMPEGYKHFSKTKPMRLDHFRPIVEWWDNRKEIEQDGSPKAKKYAVQELMDGGYNLDLCGFPHEEEKILDPFELIAEYQKESNALQAKIQQAQKAMTCILKGETKKLQQNNLSQMKNAYTNFATLNEKFPDAMKKSILQYAIQGKLIEQRAEEGMAKELLTAIKKEKARLIKEGKLKKEKPLPKIKAEEIPFEIPESWEWVRIGEIFNLQAGKNISATVIQTSQDEKHPYPCYGGNGLRGYVSMYNRDGTYPLIGRQGALCGNINFAADRFYATEHAVVTETYCETSVQWAGIFLKALNLNQYATATAQPGLAVKTINQVLIPVPPLAEQKRIAAKIEELMGYCGQLQEETNA